MFKLLLITLVPFLALFSEGVDNIFNAPAPVTKTAPSGILEKMIVADGTVSMDVNLGKRSTLAFNIEKDSFFTVMVLNGELRGPLPSSMKINSDNPKSLPSLVNRSGSDLVLENTTWGAQYELSVRDGKSGFVFFNIEGHTYDYDQNTQMMQLVEGRVLVSEEYAKALGRPTIAGTVVGSISFSAKLRAIEVSQIVDGEVKSDVLPANRDPEVGTTPGPDVAVGDLNGLAQFGSSSGTKVGLAVGTDSCNFGTVDLDWFALPSNNHPVIPQNMYRMSGGVGNDDRFEQISQSNVKHAFTALTENLCGLGCNNVGGTRLGSGCSDPYVASLNAGNNNALGSRAWINPFTGAFPSGGSPGQYNANNHTGHTHNGTSHRMATEMSDLNPALNPGATYYAEAQYVTPHEYVWCQANPTQCNMYNNVSYRRYTPTGTTSFTFSPNGATQRLKIAVSAWTGATLVELRPAPGVDGSLTVAYKITNPSAGVWHYEYAVYNMNLDRAIQSFSIPLGAGITLSNVGFRSPPQHPGTANDGSLSGLGFSSGAWAQTQNATEMTWSSETFAQNQNANAIRWGTLYNFSFDSNRPPTNVNATLGFFKTGSPATIAIQGPSAAAASNVTVAGRVLANAGRGLSNAKVTISGPGGPRVTMTNSFGYFSFDGVATGSNYTISVSGKMFTYANQNVAVNDNITNLSFTPNL